MQKMCVSGAKIQLSTKGGPGKKSLGTTALGFEKRRSGLSDTGMHWNQCSVFIFNIAKEIHALEREK